MTLYPPKPNHRESAEKVMERGYLNPCWCCESCLDDTVYNEFRTLHMSEFLRVCCMCGKVAQVIGLWRRVTELCHNRHDERYPCWPMHPEQHALKRVLRLIR